MGTPTSENIRAASVESRLTRILAKDTSIAEMLEKQRRLLDEAIDTCTREFAAVPAGKYGQGALALTDKDAKKLDILSTSLAKLVTAEVQWRKQCRVEGADVTPEQEDGAIVDLILAMDPDRRAALSKRIAKSVKALESE